MHVSPAVIKPTARRLNDILPLRGSVIDRFAAGETIEFKTLLGTRTGVVMEVVPPGKLPQSGTITSGQNKRRREESYVIGIDTSFRDAADRPRIRTERLWVGAAALKPAMVRKPSIDMTEEETAQSFSM